MRLLVNLGTFDAERRSAIEAAIGAAKTARMPWVLDPVFIQVAPARAHFARQLLTRGPAVVRLNTVSLPRCRTTIPRATPLRVSPKRMAP